MFDYFVFPVNFNDLEQENHAMNRHRVFLADIAISDRDVIRRLKNIDQAFNQRFDTITDQENFDFLYSVIKCFAENLQAKSMKILQELSMTIRYITQHMLGQLNNLSQSQIPMQKLRISFKMVMFLCLYFISSSTPKKQKVQGDLITETLNKEKGRKKLKEGIQVSRMVTENQKKCIELIRESLKINFGVLWQRKEIDTEYFKKFFDVCIKILESNLVKDEEINTCIFQIMESILNSSYCESIGSTFQTVLANLVYQGQVLDNLIQFFAKARGAELQKVCTQALTLVVIYLMNKQNLNAESQSVRNTKEFLSRLSELIPKTFHTNLSCFIGLFRHESYYMRNAIVDILLNILRHVMSGPEADQLYKEPKQKFINILLQRIYDKNSFCRSHVLGVLGCLTSQKLAPKKYLVLLMKAGIDRVKDQSVNSRKKALQLVNLVIDELCHENMMPLDQIQREIQIAELQLKTLNEDEQKLKLEMDQVDQQEKLEELVAAVKLNRKRIKALQDKEISLYEQKEVHNLIGTTINSVRILLGSKTDTDVLETIKLFIKLHRLGFQGAQAALPDIRILIFSKQKKIKDQVLTNFIYLHLNKKSQEIARELIGLFSRASAQDQSALQEIIQTVISQSLSKGIIVIKPQVFSHMWNQFVQYERAQSNPVEKRSILTILRVAFSKDQSLIKQQNLESFFNIIKSYVESNDPDFHIVKEIARIISIQGPAIAAAAKKHLVILTILLVKTQGSTNNQWISACQGVLTCIYKICDSPQKLAQMFIKKLHQNLERDRSVKSLCQFIYTLSHSCLKCLIYLDGVENKVKGMRQKQAGQQQEQLDKVMGGQEAELQQKIQQIQLLSEKIIEDPFINRWIAIIEKIVGNFKDGNELETTCVLAYCKFMCLSPSFCHEKFPLIVKLLNSGNLNSVNKNNLIISMGDLLHRFPNVIEPYNRYLYQHLHDRDPKVRKTTLTVITHLSLNDMIKVKSDLCDVALLFQDSDPQIESLVKQFFHQMNRKDPKILFNLLPDALSRFSNVQKQGNESTFRTFLENIQPMLQKDKYSQSLVTKLCERLANSLNLLQIANTAHCLAEININQKALRKIIQNFQTFRKTLENQQVLQSFKNLITKLKKSQKSDLKSLIEELQQKVAQSGEEVFNADQIKRRNQEKANKKQPKRKGVPPATSARNKRKRMEQQEAQNSDEQMQAEPKNNNLRTRQQPKRNKKMRVIHESQENDDEDQDYRESN